MKIVKNTIGLVVFGSILSGCVTNVLDIPVRGEIAVPTTLVSQMKKQKMSVSSPVLVRIFKQESELEVWKQDASGKYALLKTYPICRWSGKLGPKKKTGDRQAPEGFYDVSTTLLNPNSQYYLSFNLGYPNRLEQALNYTGDAMMVHGACTSAGCFAISDDQVAEVYAVVRDALRRGQKTFQVQAFPFRMTAANMASNSSDPNFQFWRDLKVGYDLFEKTRKEPSVGYCEGRYKFGDEANAYANRSPLAACSSDGTTIVSALVSQPISGLMSSTTMEDVTNSSSSPLAYDDGGMHIKFRKILGDKGPEYLSKKTSIRSDPVSRPKAALADPYLPEKK